MYVWMCLGALKSYKSRIRSCWPSSVSSAMTKNCARLRPETASELHTNGFLFTLLTPNSRCFFYFLLVWLSVYCWVCCSACVTHESVALHGRIASLQQQLDDAVKQIDEMKAARRRQAEMVSVGTVLHCLYGSSWWRLSTALCLLSSHVSVSLINKRSK